FGQSLALKLVPRVGNIRGAGHATQRFVIMEAASATQRDVARYTRAIEAAGTADRRAGVWSIDCPDKGGAAANSNRREVGHAIDAQIGRIACVVKNAAAANGNARAPVVDEQFQTRARSNAHIPGPRNGETAGAVKD